MREQRTVYAGGVLFDGTGAAPESCDVAVAAGRVVEVGTGLDGDTVVDLDGRGVLPGLFDCHVHVTISSADIWRQAQQPFSYRFFQAAANLERTLAAGITMVRDAGGADLGVKHAVRDGLVQGPRIQLSIAMISQTGGHGDGWLPSGLSLSLLGAHPGVPETVVDGPDAMRHAVREVIRAGADAIKVATSGGVTSPNDDPHEPHFEADELAALMSVAGSAQRPVLAHAIGGEGVKRAVRAGVRSVEHGIYLDDEAVALMLDHGTYLVPTLVAPIGLLEAVRAGGSFAAETVRKAEEVVQAHGESFRRAVDAGVPVALGTDTGITPHGDNLRELGLMVAGGMTPDGALHSATLAAARLLGVDDQLGSVEVGKRADLVVVDGHPHDLVKRPDAVTAVVMDGRHVAGTVGAGS